MATFKSIKDGISAAIASGVIKPIENAPVQNSSSGFMKISDIAKVAEAVPNAKSTTSDVGSMYKRLTASDIEEEKKKKVGMKKGGKVSSASKRADGIATKGKTRGKMV
jgi:hypothetical protein